MIHSVPLSVCLAYCANFTCRGQLHNILPYSFCRNRRQGSSTKTFLPAGIIKILIEKLTSVEQNLDDTNVKVYIYSHLCYFYRHNRNSFILNFPCKHFYGSYFNQNYMHIHNSHQILNIIYYLYFCLIVDVSWDIPQPPMYHFKQFKVVR